MGLLATFPLIGISYAQSTSPTEIPEFKYGSRFNAFAGANIAEAGDASSMYWNPANVAFLESRSVLWDYLQDWSGNSKSELFAAPVYQGKEMSATLGGTLAVVGIGNNSGLADRLSLYGIDVATGIELTPTLSIGVRGVMNYGALAGNRVWAVSSALGILYTPGPDISYGIVYDGIGDGLGYTFQPNEMALEQLHAPQTLHLGLIMHFPSARLERVISIALSNDKIFGQSGIRYNGGIEWCVTRYFFTRVGYVISPTNAGATYGAGIDSGVFRLDYTVSPNALMDRFHEFTLSVPF
ncbi:MAG TPA: hypothetical protein VMM58_05710 [Bacteroidota bacterium]|nr:hypothetical protein [Bacteroidota bacterium]